MRSRVHVSHPKYDVTKAFGVNGLVGYLVKLYCIYCNGSIYHVYSQADWIDNFHLMTEQGFCCTTFTYDLLVTPFSHEDIFNDIHSYVSASGSN